MIYVGRLAQVADVTTADDLRLLPDVSAVTAIAIAALMGAVLERRGSREPGPPRRRVRALWVGATASVVALSAITWISFGVRWHATEVTAYLAALRDDVSGAAGGGLLPNPVPDEIVPGWVDSAFTTAPLITLLNPSALASELPGRPSVIGPDGAVTGAALTRVSGAPVPDGFCGAVLNEGEQSITLPLADPAPYYRGAIVTLGLLVGDATRVNVVVTDRDGAVSEPLVQDPPELLNGPHRVYAPVPSGTAVASITVVVETPNTAGVFVTSAQVVSVGAGSSSSTTITAPPRSAPGAHYLLELEGLRALAAVAVLLTHAGFLSGATSRSILPGFLARMDIGVAVFFVLSGLLSSDPTRGGSSSATLPRIAAPTPSGEQHGSSPPGWRCCSAHWCWYPSLGLPEAPCGSPTSSSCRACECSGTSPGCPSCGACRPR